MPPSIHLRPAIPTDLPILTTILIAAFAPGPWSTLLFPPNLRSQTTQQQEQQQCRTTTNEEFNWRLRTTAAQLGRTGHAHVVATSSLPEDDGEILGWAHWIDKAVAAAAVYGADEQQQTNRLTSTEEEKKRTTTTKERGECASLGGCPTSPELDTAALARMGEEGAAVEVFARAALGEQRWENSFELHYLIIDPVHQGQGVGRMLTQALLDRAAQESKAVWLRSTLAGRKLYLALGFEEVGEGKVCGERQFAMVKRVADG